MDEPIEVLEKKLKEKNNQIIGNHRDLDSGYKNLNQIHEYKKLLADCRYELKVLVETEKDTVSKADTISNVMEQIAKAASTIKDAYDGELVKAIGNILKKLTGVYDEIVIDKELNVYIKDNDNKKQVKVTELSRGLLDQLYFAVRIGLMDTINENLETPLLLDDCFVNYDDERLENVLQVLGQLNRQIIILTCQSRESIVLDDLNIPYNKALIA